MPNFTDILETLDMIEREHLDVRTVTMGISLLDCACGNGDELCKRVYDKITAKAKDLVSVVCGIEKEYGIPIIHKRISVTPVSLIGGGLTREGYVRLAETLDRAAADLGVNFIGGFSGARTKGHNRFGAGDARLDPLSSCRHKNSVFERERRLYPQRYKHGCRHAHGRKDQTDGVPDA